MNRSWRVVFRGPVSDEVLAALPDGEMVHVSGHEGAGRRSSTIWVRAADAAAAEAAVRTAITTPGAIEPATPLPYWMSIGVPEDDADALDSAISERRADSIDSLITKEPSDGFAEVMLEVVGDTDQGAVRRGLDEYRDLRIAARLEPADPPYFTLHPPWPGRQPQHHHRVLLERARQLQEGGEWDLAIVVAQTAFEVLAAQVVYERLEARDVGGLRAHITSHIRTYSLLDDRTQKLWHEQQAIIAELDDLTQLVADVVELARGLAPSEHTEPIELDLVVKKAIERARRRSPQLEFNLELEPTSIVNAPDRVTRAVTNVIDNARKWSSPDARIEIVLRDGLLCVRDHGPGFNERDLQHVFDRFYRAEAARRMPGSGLGLAIVKQAAEAHGGFAEAANAPDGGAMVRVSFGDTADTRTAADPQAAPASTAH